MTDKLAQVRRNAEYLDAYYECNKLVSLHQIYISQGKMVEQLGLWADREDTSFEAVWGTYLGYEGIKRCFMMDYGDIRDPRNEKAYTGYMCMQSINSEFVIIADDMQTARGRYMATGANVMGQVARKESDKGTAYWVYANYGFDFIKVGGKWRIWHVKMTPVLNSPYDTTWSKTAPYEGFPLRETHEDIAPKMPVFNYSPKTKYTAGMSYPAPYKTFADVAPGYGPAL